jgi:protein TonB
MTHVYSADGSRQAAVFTAIIGLHCAVLLVVLNDQIPIMEPIARDPGPIVVLPPKPAPPVTEQPGKVEIADSVSERVQKPDIDVPVFPLPDVTSDSTDASGEAKDGQLPTAAGPVVRTPANLMGLSRDFAAVVRACYPAGARRDAEEGLLKLAVTIGTGGQVRSWRVVESTGFPRLDAAAACVLDKLRFNAAREDGRAVQSEVLLPIVFRLN